MVEVDPHLSLVDNPKGATSKNPLRIVGEGCLAGGERKTIRVKEEEKKLYTSSHLKEQHSNGDDQPKQ